MVTGQIDVDALRQVIKVEFRRVIPGAYSDPYLPVIFDSLAKVAADAVVQRVRVNVARTKVESEAYWDVINAAQRLARRKYSRRKGCPRYLRDAVLRLEAMSHGAGGDSDGNG